MSKEDKTKVLSILVSLYLCYMVLIGTINLLEFFETGRRVLAIANIPMIFIGLNTLVSNKREEEQRGKEDHK